MAADADPTAVRRSAWRSWTRFALGFPIGLLLFAAAFFGVGVAYNESMAGDVRLDSRGGDLTAHGGKALVVERRSGVIRQTCNGGCDDLRVVNLGRGNGLRELRVLNAAGECVACRRGAQYVMTHRPERWTVGGGHLEVARVVGGRP